MLKDMYGRDFSNGEPAETSKIADNPNTTGKVDDVEDAKSIDPTESSFKSMMTKSEESKVRGVPNGYQMRGQNFKYGAKPNKMGTDKDWVKIAPKQQTKSDGKITKFSEQSIDLNTSFKDMMGFAKFDYSAAMGLERQIADRTGDPIQATLDGVPEGKSPAPFVKPEKTGALLGEDTPIPPTAQTRLDWSRDPAVAPAVEEIPATSKPTEQQTVEDAVATGYDNRLRRWLNDVDAIGGKGDKPSVRASNVIQDNMIRDEQKKVANERKHEDYNGPFRDVARPHERSPWSFRESALDISMRDMMFQKSMPSYRTGCGVEEMDIVSGSPDAEMFGTMPASADDIYG